MDEILNIQEIAQRFIKSERWVHNHVPELGGFKIGGLWFFTEGGLVEEYLTVNELSNRIKFSRQSLYNLIHRKTFILGKHYLKPTPKKILFRWSSIRVWLGESTYSNSTTSEFNSKKRIEGHTIKSKQGNSGSLINI